MSAWKPKLKALTEEEAVQQAKRELAKFWVGSEPIFAAIPAGAGASVHPLGETFAKGNWLLVFADPTFFVGQSAVAYLREWHRRFHLHEIGLIWVLEPAYAFISEPERADALFKIRQNAFITVVDHGRLLAKGFNAEVLPEVMFFSNGKRLFTRTGAAWLEGTEAFLQAFLREKDRGLPLAPLFDHSQRDIRDSGFLEFSDGRIFPKPGFQTNADGHRIARFPSTKSDAASPFQIEGGWVQDAEGIVTADPSAIISLDSRGTCLSLIARPIKLSCEISVELDGRPVYDSVAGENITFAEDGQSVLRLQEPVVGRLLSKLPPGTHRVSLKFPKSAENPVCLYGLRFGTES